MLPIPKLDDRSYEEIRDEAIKNIIRHCPEWTNHNASDPGITLIELFSAMSEMLLYRLNRVPEKNYLAFLDMIGINQRLASPAKTRVQFGLSVGYQMEKPQKNTILIPKNTIISTEPMANEEPLIFETSDDLRISNVKIENIYSQTYSQKRRKEVIIDHFEDFENKRGFIPFEEKQKSENFAMIYLSAKELAIFQNSAIITILFRLPTSMRSFNISENFLRKMDWQYFNGENWQNLNLLSTMNVKVDDKDADVLSVSFQGGNEEFIEGVFKDISDNPNFYIRAILREAPKWLANFSAYEVSIITESVGSGITPESCYHNLSQLDLNSDFYPFGERPKVDNRLSDEIFLIKCDEAFAMANTEVTINFLHSQNIEYIMPRGYNNLKIEWEYSKDKNEWGKLIVEDLTNAFTKNGQIHFSVPKDMQKSDLNGDEGYFIRAKIIAGNFGDEEKVEYDLKTGDIKSQSPKTLNPPILSKVSINYRLPRIDFSECLTFNNYKYKKVVFDKNRPVEFFEESKDKTTAIYFGFDSFLSEEYLDVYFKLDENVMNGKNLNSEQRLIEWEILKRSKWIKLNILDKTDNLTKSGEIKFKIPIVESLESFKIYANEFDRMWIRGRVLFNSLYKIPKVEAILLNSVEAVQKESFYNEFVGKSMGLPNMRFKLNHSNLISAPILEVEGKEYKAVDRFIDSTKDDRVFRFNGISGEIEFGDGEYGVIPSPREAIFLKEYAITKGKKGNIAKDKLRVLRQSINYVDFVKNIEPAIGGSDGDDLNDLKLHAPSIFKTMDRAVTTEDYEVLAKNYSSFIAKAKCVSNCGEIVVIIITKDILDESAFVNRKLIEDLSEFLHQKSLVTVKPIVQAPKVINLKVNVKLKFTLENEEFSKVDIENRLLKEAKKYFNPFIGGDRGDGYQIGRNVTKADFYKILNRVDSNFYFEEIKFQKDNLKNMSEKLILAYDELVKFDSLKVIDITYDV